MHNKLKDFQMNYLFSAILSLEDMEECYKLFDDLCTAPELKSLAQRMQVANLLDQGKTYAEIIEQTGVSTATISRVNRSLSYGADGYRTVLDRMNKCK